MPAGRRFSAATAPASGLVAPAGQSSVIRTAAKPCCRARLPSVGWSSPAPTVSGASAGVVAASAVVFRAGFFLCFLAGVSTRTIGRAATEASFPAQSVAWIVTGKIPARDGSAQLTVCQPPETEKRRSPPSASTRTLEGLDTQNETAPGAVPASLNAGGCDSNPANRVAAAAKRGSLFDRLCRSWITYSW